jgi:hypothetical protein
LKIDEVGFSFAGSVPVLHGIGGDGEIGDIHDRFLSRASENLSRGNGDSPSLGGKVPPSAVIAELPNCRRSLGATNAESA